IEREPDNDVRVRFGGELSEWIRGQDFLSGGVFTGCENVEYRWKCHRRRLQVTLLCINGVLKNTMLTPTT
ncbi:hypothetical protein EI94DRAFT_1714015, partial [Lactarius quietus]